MTPRGGPSPRARPPSLALTGLGSVLLAMPLAVVGEATGPYDDPKVWALSILMALTALGWIASSRPGAVSASSSTDLLGGRIVRAGVLLCLVWSLVATVTSIAPAQSVFGTFGRGMGLLTIGFSGLAFFVAHSGCQRPGAARWLVDVALLGSVPVCVLALAQVAGWDPLPKAWDPAVQTLTVRSTFGTHVFLGGYLVVLIPLTVARLEWELRERSASGRWLTSTPAQWWRILAAVAWLAGAAALIGLGSRWPLVWWALVPWGVLGVAVFRCRADDVEAVSPTKLALWLLVGLLAGQVLVVLLSRARGAFIGMLVGVGVTAFAALIRRRAWKTLVLAAFGSTALLVFLILLNLPGSPIAALGKIPILSRLGDIGYVERGSPGWVRVQLWRGISDGWRRQLGGEAVIPEAAPRLRSLIGYGPETQIIVLEPLTSTFVGHLSASGEGWYARYVFDRAHNALLDRLVTEGLVGVGLWMLLLGGIVVLGVARLRSGAGVGESTIRIGALGAILGHLAEGQVGMATPTLLVLFWVAAALLTSDSRVPATVAGAARGPARSRARWWGAALVAAALVTLMVGWASTRWLLASMAYANGVRLGIAGRLVDAYGEFRRSLALMPWLSLPAESAAYAGLRLAIIEREPLRRIALLHEAEALLRQSRDHATPGPSAWALTGQIALAEARNGEPSQLATSREAFSAALRLRPDDPRLLAQSALVWLESGDALQARRTAEKALAREPREWVAWAVLARVSKEQGDVEGMQRAAARARDLAPPDAHALLDGLLR